MSILSYLCFLVLCLSVSIESAEEITLERKLQQALSNCEIEEYRRSTPNYGWHVICLRMLEAEDGFGSEIFAVGVLNNGVNDMRFTYKKKIGDAGPLAPLLVRIAEFTGSSTPSIEKWKVFEESSHRLRSVDRIMEAGVAFVVTGGVWMWPGKHIGYDQYDFGFQTRLVTIGLNPLVFSIESFATSDEMLAIIDAAPSMNRTQPQDATDGEVHFLTTLDDESMSSIKPRLMNYYGVPEAVFLDWPIVSYYEGNSRSRTSQDGIYGRVNTLLLFLSSKGSEFVVGDQSESPSTFCDKNKVIMCGGESESVKHYNITLQPNYDEPVEYIEYFARDNILCVPPKAGRALLIYNNYADGSVWGEGVVSSCPLKDKASQWVLRLWQKP